MWSNRIGRVSVFSNVCALNLEVSLVHPEIEVPVTPALVANVSTPENLGFDMPSLVFNLAL